MTTDETVNPEVTHPLAAREALLSLEGRWTIRGMEGSFTEVCELFPGGHHLVCYATSQDGEEVSRHMSIFTWSLEEGCFLYFGIGSSGSVKRYRGTFDRGAWNFTGSTIIDQKAALVRIVTTPSEDGFHFLEQHSFDNEEWITHYEVDYLRIVVAEELNPPA